MILSDMMNALKSKDQIISDSPALAERLKAALDRLEAALSASEAENARLRRIEAASKSALTDLDALIGAAE